MSHFKERREKNCLNCNAEVQGRYCHICGQENVDTYETAWHLVTHFFQDITHYDGKFISTIRYLVTKPGFLTKEYINGRRASYLSPVRMYIFSSALFFLIFFFVSEQKSDKVNILYNGKNAAEIDKMDSLAFANFTSSITKGKPMTREAFVRYKDSVDKRTGFRFTTEKFASRSQYDSLVKAGVKKHSWFERQLIYKEISINEKYKGSGRAVLNSFVNTLIHTFPQLLFLSLPLFALILQIFYSRRKKFFYANHAIFGVHFYIFLFIQLLILIAITKLNDVLHTSWIGYIAVLIGVYIFYYLYRSMRVVYEQGRWKTVLKFILLNLSHFFVLMFLLIIFIFFSLFKL